jgi:hypothetical protein
MVKTAICEASILNSQGNLGLWEGALLVRLSPLVAVVAAAIVGSGQVSAQSPFPSAGAPPFDGNGSLHRPTVSDSCMNDFRPLREEAERRGKLIKAASDHHAPPDETCKLFAAFSAAEVKMIEYVEARAAGCGIPAQIADQLKTNHKGTEGVQKKVCMIAEQVREGPTLTDVLGSSAAGRVWPPRGPTGDFDWVR